MCLRAAAMSRVVFGSSASCAPRGLRLGERERLLGRRGDELVRHGLDVELRSDGPSGSFGLRAFGIGSRGLGCLFSGLGSGSSTSVALPRAISPHAPRR